MTRTQRLSVAGLAWLALSVAGCGAGGTVTVDGKLVENGSPIQLQDGEAINMAFTTDGPTPRAFPAKMAPDGRFTVSDGTDRGGIPPGQYTITVKLETYNLGGPKRFAAYAAGQSKLKCEVGPSGAHGLVIDLGTGTVTK